MKLHNYDLFYIRIQLMLLLSLGIKKIIVFGAIKLEDGSNLVGEKLEKKNLQIKTCSKEHPPNHDDQAN